MLIVTDYDLLMYPMHAGIGTSTPMTGLDNGWMDGWMDRFLDCKCTTVKNAYMCTLKYIRHKIKLYKTGETFCNQDFKCFKIFSRH
uniref:Uncharacterized protein n=1 Tax=Anguilla anguilla TaxID=7936 RepID=A0A0E9RJT8_ANGAN